MTADTQARAPAVGASRLAVYAALVFVIVAWSGSFVAARMVLSATAPGAATLSPTMLATVRFLMASAIFLPVLLRQHARVQPLKVRDLPIFLLLGQLGISGYFWLQYTGVQLTNAGIAAVLAVSLIPLVTMVLSGLVLGEALTWQRAAALSMGAAGVVVVVSQQSLQVSLETGFLFGALCLIANALCFAVYSTLIRGISARYPPLTVTSAMMISGTLGLVLLSAATEDWRTVGALSGSQWIAIVYLAIACSVLAYFFYIFALSRLEASKVAVWLYAEPVLAVALGAAMLGEVVAVQTIVGGAIIIAGLYITQRT
jgi:drug/metabolite transporter (DMT)-like permease